MEERETLRYSVWDPTGNLTALVESAVAPERQAAAAAALMRRRPELEQVGFVRFPGPAGDGVRAELRMVGGEFCGNASMCAAALGLLRAPADAAESVLIRVSGVREPVAVRLRREGEASFRAAVRMPAPLEIAGRDFAFEGLAGRLSLVRMEGIAQLLVEPGCAFFALLLDREAALRAVRVWCAELGAEALGLMFLDGEADAYRLTPLVYVPGSGTAFWENSCASGSAAAGMALAARRGEPVRLELREPGGRLCVESAPDGGETWLAGGTRLLLRV